MTDENEFNDLMSDFEIIDDKMTEIIEEHANGGGLVVASDVLPTGLPIIPLRPRPAFPGIMIPLVLNGQSQVAAMHQAMEHQAQTIGLVMVRELDDDDSIENLHKIGVAAKILKVLHSEKNAAHVLVNSLERFEIEDIQERGLTIYARVRYHFATELSVNPELRAYSMAILSTLKELVQINPLYSEEIKLFLNRSSLDDPGRLADFAANLTNSDGQQLQDILATFDVRKRIDKVLVLLKKELEVSRLQTKISKQIEEKVSAQQREFFLREQLKAIKQELGLEKEGKTTEIEKFQKRLKKLKMNEEAERAVEDEMEKLQLIEPSSPEYNVSRNYLDWLTILPWGLFSKDSYNIGRARNPRPRPLRSPGCQGEDPRVHRRRPDERRHLRINSLPGRAPRSWQNLNRPQYRRCPGPEVLPFFVGWHARRSGNQRTPSHLHRCHAGQVHPGDENRRHR